MAVPRILHLALALGIFASAVQALYNVGAPTLSWILRYCCSHSSRYLTQSYPVVHHEVEREDMFTLIIMVLLVVVAGWLDSRLNWQQVGQPKQEVERS